MNKLLFLISILLISSISIASAADVAYIVKNQQGVDPFLINEIQSTGLTTQKIFESQIQNTNFNNYQLIVIGDQELDNPNQIPVYLYPTLIVNSHNFYHESSNPQYGWSTLKGSSISPTPLKKLESTSEIGHSLFSNEFNAYIVSDSNIKTFYLGGIKASGIQPVVVKPSSPSNIVIAAAGPGARYLNNNIEQSRSVFFGITQTQYWTHDTRKLFKDSIGWLLNGSDFDNDGFFTDLDCDNTNPLINPDADEIPYDGIDQDCDGHDLDDLDNDGFSSDIVGGPDCDDQNAFINPNAPEIPDNTDQNCFNDPPTSSGPIQNITFSEDNSYFLLLHNYFHDVDSALQYSASNNNFLTITFENQIAQFTPLKDWFGTETVTITASDSYNNPISLDVSITVVDMGEPPVISDLNCVSTIDEDTTYTCEIQASDFEGDEISLSISSLTNLNCEIVNQTLTYSSSLNYYGQASCKISATDIHGSHSKLLEVTILPINDAPVINSFYPETNSTRIPITQTKTFHINPTDAENDNIIINWELNNETIPDSTNKKSFLFSKPVGTYILKAIVSDTFQQISQIWNIFVGQTSEFSCAELNGFSCAIETQICAGTNIPALDSQMCCSIACSDKPPEFKDADTCDQISNDLIIKIEDPSTNEEFELGDSIRVRLEIKNNYNKDQDLDIEVYLYDLDDDEYLDKADTTLDVNDDDNRFASLDLEIPNEADIDNEFAILVVAEDDICSQEYKKIRLTNSQYQLEIDSFILPQKASCGEQFETSITVENLGRDDQDVTLIVRNNELGIDERSSSFLLEENGQDDRETKDFILSIPEDAVPGDYEIDAIAAGKNSDTLTQTLEVTCGTSLPSESFQTTKKETTDPLAIQLNSAKESLESATTEANTQDESTNPALFIFLLLFNLLLAAGLIFFIVKFKK